MRSNCQVTILTFLVAFSSCNPAWTKDLFGLLDYKGNIVVPFTHDSVNYADDGTFELTDGCGADAKISIVDKEGKVLRSHQKASLATSSKNVPVPEGYKLVSSVRGTNVISGPDGFGLIDGDGKILIPAKYASIQKVMSARDGEETLYVANAINLPNKPYAQFFTAKVAGTDQTYTMANKDGMYFVLFDSKGTELGKYPWSFRLNSGRISEGLIRIGQFLSPQGFIDTRGQIVIKPESFVDAGDFHNGLCPAHRDDSGGWIDRSGKMVVGPFRQASLSDFGKERGIVSFHKEGQQTSGAVDRSGKFAIPPEYSVLTDCGDGVFLAAKDNRLRLIDSNNNLICLLPANCSQIVCHPPFGPQSLFPCALGGDDGTGTLQGIPRTGAKWGYCDFRGNVVIAPKFDRVEDFTGSMAIVSMRQPDGKVSMGTIDRKRNWIILPIYSWLAVSVMDRLLAGTHGDDRFDTASWKSSSSNRFGMFPQLLRDHNLIGMSQSDLIKLLGEPDMNDSRKRLLPMSVKYGLRFTLLSGPCGNSWKGVEFGMDASHKVWGWRMVGMQWEEQWFSDNVVLAVASEPAVPGNVFQKIQAVKDTGQP